MVRSACALLACVAVGAAMAAPVAHRAIRPSAAGATLSNRQVNYAPVAAWVLPPPAQSPGTTPADRPFRFLYNDQQVHIGPAGEERYGAWRMRILKPEALPAGNLTLTWQPDGGRATVHHLRIIRGGEVIDVLKDQRFTVIERETGLEHAALDGQLTATLQTAGLRVGDELEFAATVVRRDPTLGDRAFGLAALPGQGMPGAFRFRLEWPSTDKLDWRASRDLPQSPPTTANGRTSIGYVLSDPGGVILNDGAPARYNVRRLIEYSEFGGWPDVSRRIAGLFETASTLAAGSPLHAEAARIAAASNDPTERAQAALRFVQDQIRYVYVGLDGGNYRPATADETWRRRFGDCKAKTALLLALLRDLKIDAEAALVNPVADDGLDARLPNPALFNHVLVRVRIGGALHWLDGTRAGDRYLDMLPPVAFHRALPLRAAGSELERVSVPPLGRPHFIDVVDIDARAGFDKPAKVKAERVLRYDEAYATRQQLLAMSAEDADRGVRAFWRAEMAWVDPDEVSWRYDERRATLILTMAGEGRLEWKGDGASGRRYFLPGAGFYAPDLLKRPREQDQTAPWQRTYPRFVCSATTIRLPAADPEYRWTYYADPVDRTLGGVAYWRASGMKDGIVRTVMSTRALVPEISADEARAANEAVPGFNSNMSSVDEVKVRNKADAGPARGTLPFGEAVDWGVDAPACQRASH